MLLRKIGVTVPMNEELIVKYAISRTIEIQIMHVIARLSRLPGLLTIHQ